MKRIHYNKLIRDRIPKVMEERGASYKIKKLSSVAFKRELLKKVGEEAGALEGLTNKKEIVDEVADTLDVIRAVQQAFHISKKEINAAQKKALEKKGWFRKRLYLFWSEDTGYRSNERRYSKK